MDVERGDIFFGELQSSNAEGVQRGLRPMVVVQNDIGNKYSPCVLVAAGTTADKKNMKTHFTLGPESGLKEKTIFMAEQLHTISKKQLQFKIGKVPEERMPELDKAVMIQTGLLKPFDENYVLELIDDIIAVDRLFSVNMGTEEDYRRKVRRTKEIKRYCADYNYDGEWYLNKYYYKRGVMCG
jgi:mRNA interferase MazF